TRGDGAPPTITLAGSGARVRNGSVPELARRIASYFEGERVSFVDVEVDLDWCTPLQRAIAEALRAVSYGETVTYPQLAAGARAARGRAEGAARGGCFLLEPPPAADLPLPPRRRRWRHRRVRIARRRLQTPSPGARGCRSLTRSGASLPPSSRGAPATGWPS